MISRIRLFAFVIPVVLLMITAYGCKEDSPTNPGGGSPGANEVWMQGTAFNPSTKTIAAGTTITWINKDQMIHTATSGTPNAPAGIFNSGNMSNGGTFSHTFNTPGTFRYFCIPHASTMTGTIIVQ